MRFHAEDTHYCTGCNSTQRMKRNIGEALWKCPNCGILLNVGSWTDTLQVRSLRRNLVKSASKCEAESTAAAVLLAARKAERSST